MTRVIRRSPYLVQEINKLLQACAMKVVYDFFALDVVMEFGKSEFEFQRALGNLMRTVGQTWNKRQAGDFLAEIHGVEVEGCLTEFNTQAICYIILK